MRGAGEGEAGDPVVESARGRGEIDRAPRAPMGEGPRDRDPEPEAGTRTTAPNPRTYQGNVKCALLTT